MKTTYKKAVAGYLFILPFIIGFIAFMLFPILESLCMVFSNVRIDTVRHRFSMGFSGLDNLKTVLFVDAEFNRLLVQETAKMLLNVPAIIMFSLFVALLLNRQFKGRGVVRAVFFLPVILSSGVMIGLETNNTLLSGMAEVIQQGNTMKTSITGVLENILAAPRGTGGTAADFMAYIFLIVNRLYDIAMASGIQIVIFLSGLQTIPPSVYEAAEIEGATSWENFWKITFPMLSSLILVNVVYSVVDFFIRTDNEVMRKIRLTLMQRMEYGLSTAMAWLYFLAVMFILAIAGALISRKVYYYE